MDKTILDQGHEFLKGMSAFNCAISNYKLSQHNALKARKLIERIDLKNRKIEQYKKDIAYYTKSCDSFKFQKKKNGWIFVGIIEGKIYIGETTHMENNETKNDTIGKIIAIFKAFSYHKDLQEVIDFFENNKDIINLN